MRISSSLSKTSPTVRSRVILVGVVMLLYILIFPFVYNTPVWRSTVALSIVPILAAAMQFGMKGGAAAGIAVLPLHTLLFAVLDDAGAPALIGRNFWGAHVTFFTVGLIFGYLHDLRMQREQLIHKLQDALENIRRLEGLMPMCAWCKKVRNDKGYWQQLEEYLHTHTDVELTHGVCPDCLAGYQKDLENTSSTKS